MAKLFVTDYASYNEGRQFEKGQWVDLADFSDVEEFFEFCVENCVPERHQDDPELMFTDCDEIPDSLYGESLSKSELERIFLYVEADFENYSIYDWLNLHNEWASDFHQDDYIYEFDEEFFETFFRSSFDAVRASVFGNLNFSDDFICFNGCGNLESLSENRLMDYIDQNVLIEYKLDNL